MATSIEPIPSQKCSEQQWEHLKPLTRLYITHENLGFHQDCSTDEKGCPSVHYDVINYTEAKQII